MSSCKGAPFAKQVQRGSAFIGGVGSLGTFGITPENGDDDDSGDGDCPDEGGGADDAAATDGSGRAK